MTNGKSVVFNIAAEYDSASTDSASEVKDNFAFDDMDISIRKIKNGYLVRRSWTQGEGDKKEWKSEEEYYDHNPL